MTVCTAGFLLLAAWQHAWPPPIAMQSEAAAVGHAGIMVLKHMLSPEASSKLHTLKGVDTLSLSAAMSAASVRAHAIVDQ